MIGSISIYMTPINALWFDLARNAHVVRTAIVFTPIRVFSLNGGVFLHRDPVISFNFSAAGSGLHSRQSADGHDQALAHLRNVSSPGFRTSHVPLGAGKHS